MQQVLNTPGLSVLRFSHGKPASSANKNWQLGNNLQYLKLIKTAKEYRSFIITRIYLDMLL